MVVDSAVTEKQEIVCVTRDGSWLVMARIVMVRDSHLDL